MEWAKEIEKRTQGAVKISVFPGGTLTKLPQLYDGVVKGLSDIGFGIFAISGGRFPVMSALDLPMSYPSAMVATRAANEFARDFNPEEIQDVKLLYLHGHGPGTLFTKKTIRSLSDLKGVKIRATGTSAKIVKALGGVPVALPIGGTYEALQKGIAEGTFASMEALKGFKLAEVTKSVTLCTTVGYTTTFFIVMNKGKWASLPDSIKKTFEATNEEWTDKHGKTWDATDKVGLDFAKSRGNEIVELSKEENAKWGNAVKVVIDEYITKTPNGSAYVEKIQASVEKYSK
jgi:TRAP-type C4-dicarboxylate transport system substrate-binding protein